MAKLRKIAEDILARYPDRFTTEFEHNKRELEKAAIIRSKELRNKIAGYIVRYLKKAGKEEESPADAS